MDNKAFWEGVDWIYRSQKLHSESPSTAASTGGQAGLTAEEVLAKIKGAMDEVADIAGRPRNNDFALVTPSGKIYIGDFSTISVVLMHHNMKGLFL